MQEELELTRRTHQRDMERKANEAQVHNFHAQTANLPCGMRSGFLEAAWAMA